MSKFKIEQWAENSSNLFLSMINVGVEESYPDPDNEIRDIYVAMMNF